MQNILEAMLNKEHAERKLEQAKAEDIREESNRLLAALHNAYKPCHATVQALVLKDDYNKPVSMQSQSSFYRNVPDPSGLTFHAAKRISQERVSLELLARTESEPAQFKLTLHRIQPYQSQELGTFPGHTPPEHLLEKFFQAILPYVHANSLRPKNLQPNHP